MARDLATVWNWQQMGAPEHNGQHRLNFQLARWGLPLAAVAASHPPAMPALPAARMAERVQKLAGTRASHCY